MTEDRIVSVEIDREGRLCVKPATQTFGQIYRAAMEVGWDAGRKYLFSPLPREWSYSAWFRQIIAAAEDGGVQLILTDQTTWIDVPDLVRDEILASASGASA